MNIVIRDLNNANENIEIVNFPCDEEILDKICNSLGIKMTTESNCYILDSSDKDFSKVLLNNICNIDELNYLMKRLDGFSAKETKQFYATAFVEEPKTMAELINLSFNTHCYSLVTDFSNLKTIGRDLYLSERQAVASKELDELDGESYAMEVINNNASFVITPYGVLYKNNNQPDQVYNGRHFPPYEWQESIASVELRAKDESEFIYLPYFDIEIQKALMRLEVPNLSDCEITIDNYNFPDRILNIISDDTPLQLNIDALNDMASKLKGMGTKDIKYFENLMEYVKPKTIDEILALTDSMYEFEIYNKVTDAKSYGKYMICESGHFEYDSNLEDYIDFEKYGKQKILNEVGVFCNNGYIVYHGYNQKLSNMLSENLGMKLPKSKEQQILKLYMPLTITTYDVENEYGYRETLDEPLELSNYEVVDYIDKILEAIEKNNLPEENQRGLMRYYDDHDSINAKVSKYIFSVEMVDEELMGVAVLTLNDDLALQELKKIKEDITGQASDGWGEGFEQREVSTDMGDMYISFWTSSNSWSIKTAEEMGIEQPRMGGIQFE